MARRSFLFAPGNDPELMRKAAASEADIAVFDLEDAVAPAKKAEARTQVRDVLTREENAARICVRVNPIGAGAETDVGEAFDQATPASVMLPKTTSAEDIHGLSRLLEKHDARVPVIALIETAAGVLAADAIAATDPTDALVFGAEDLAADIGATRTSDGTEVLYARERVVIAARAADIAPIDPVYTDYRDLDGLRRETEFAAQLGFDGKLAIHPDQIPVINDAFAPSEEEVEWAERVVAVSGETEAGVFEIDGEMIDSPLIRQAERILARVRKADRR